MLTLYAAPRTISVAVAIALEEAGLPYNLEMIDFASAQQTRAPYLAVNPKGRVPALETGDGVLTETGALLDYIGALAPEAGLIPAGAVQAARMREVMYYLASTMHVNHAHGMRGARWVDDPAAQEAMRAKVPQTMAASAAHIEATCRLDPFALGATLTLADPYLYMVCSWLPGDDVAPEDTPRIAQFMAVMNARDSVARVRDAGLL